MTQASDRSLEQLIPLLGRSFADPALAAVLGPRMADFVRDEGAGWLPLTEHGIGVGFKEAQWPGDSGSHRDDEMILKSLFLYRGGREGFAPYSGAIPGGLTFTDTRATIEAKLGQPKASGGGGYSRLSNRTIPIWIKFECENMLLHVQFDEIGIVEMVTLIVKGW